MVGETLGSYRIARAIGEGGMGTVYLAEHTLLARQAAIKVLRPEMCHRAELVTRFFNEARAASTVQHPGIVEIFDFGRRPDGSAFIVMELLHGESLGTRLRRIARLSEAETASFGRKVCGGLAAAHARGIIHRDIKPDNLFLIPDAFAVGGERVKILDFGIAKLAAEQHQDGQRTRTGVVMGTPAYMSPEQCKGTGEVDHRADLYALGCVLYAMVCGRPPFVSEGMGELMAKHIYEPVPPPSLFAPMSPGFEQVLLRALAKHPDARHGTADELADALGLASPSGAHPVAGGSPISATHAVLATPTPTDAAAAMTTIAEGSIAERMASGSVSTGSASGIPATGPDMAASRRRARWPLVGAGLVGAAAIAYVLGTGGQGSAPRGDDARDARGSRSAAPASPAGSAAPSAEASPPSAEPSPPSAEASPPSAESSPPSAEASLPSPPPPAPASITLRIGSVPPGADVYRMPSRERVGATPLELTQPAAPGEAVFSIELGGKRPETIALPTDRDGAREVRLRGRGGRRPAEKAPLAPGSTLNPFKP